MTLKSTDTSADSFLILIVPVALVIMFLFSTWPLLLALAIGSLLWNSLERYRWQKWSRTINPTFHRLIQENQGQITVIDLAMKANLSAAKAKRYLDHKAAEFGARVLEPEDGSNAYFFVTAKTLGSIFDASEPPVMLPQPEVESSDDEDAVSAASEPVPAEPETADAPARSLQQQDTIADTSETTVASEDQPEELASESLLQSELAKRLAVNSSTVFKHRSNPDFAQWSQSRDPHGVAWQYSEEDKRFFPLQNSKN